jgi:hypothetical protein
LTPHVAFALDPMWVSVAVLAVTYARDLLAPHPFRRQREIAAAFKRK